MILCLFLYAVEIIRMTYLLLEQDSWRTIYFPSSHRILKSTLHYVVSPALKK